MNEKELALFLCEVGIITFGDDIYFDIEIINKINKFIYKTYLEDKKSLRIIIPYFPLIEECIQKEAMVITPNIVFYLIKKYYGEESYAKLVEEVGIERDKEINELALKFVAYRRNRLLLAKNKASPSYPNILQ